MSNREKSCVISIILIFFFYFINYIWKGYVANEYIFGNILCFSLWFYMCRILLLSAYNLISLPIALKYCMLNKNTPLDSKCVSVFLAEWFQIWLVLYIYINFGGNLLSELTKERVKVRIYITTNFQLNEN